MRRVLTQIVAGTAVLLALAAPALGQTPRRGPMVSAEYAFWPPAFALAQQRLMTRTLDAVQPQRDGVRDVYVLSVGLHGDHVFEQEATQAGQALARHFAAEGRAITLSNYHGEGAAHPAASPDNVQAALARIAELMNKDEDVLVLFITSHGAAGSGIVGFEPRPSGAGAALRDFMISPGNLRGSLDASGIKNRLVILSACFSGQFIPTLQDANTAVLTAAIATRPSFGCQPERDWTYFGDAFFAQSLPNAKSITSAFDNARKLIGQWETEQQLDPSQPQIFIGDEMKKILPVIEKR